MHPSKGVAVNTKDIALRGVIESGKVRITTPGSTHYGRNLDIASIYSNSVIKEGATVYCEVSFIKIWGRDMACAVFSGELDQLAKSDTIIVLTPSRILDSGRRVMQNLTDEAKPYSL
jgi:hypothetical protein